MAVSAHPDFGSKRSKIDPSARPYEGRSEATNPLRFGYRPSNGPMQLDSPRSPWHLGATGLPRGVRMPELAKSAVLAGGPILAFVATSSSQALIHGTSYPLWSSASDFGLLSRWLLTVTQEMATRWGRKQQEMQGWALWHAL